MKKIATTSALLLCLFLFSLPAHAAELAGVTLPDTIETDSHQLALNGIALREKFVFDVYVAGLYLDATSSDPQTILSHDGPRKMIMVFVRDVDAKPINKAWMEGLTANVATPSASLTGRFEQLCTMMTDIKDGQAMEFVYLPGKGTQITVADHLAGTIPGKDFADAILATWIGPKPGPGKSFKTALLGQ